MKSSTRSSSVYRNQNVLVRAVFERAGSARKVLCVALDYAKTKHVAARHTCSAAGPQSSCSLEALHLLAVCVAHDAHVACAEPTQQASIASVNSELQSDLASATSTLQASIDSVSSNLLSSLASATSTLQANINSVNSDLQSTNSQLQRARTDLEDSLATTRSQIEVGPPPPSPPACTQQCAGAAGRSRSDAQ
jgi:hypothetical protein